MPLPTGAALWYKADAGVYKDAGVTPCSDGDTVRQWNDQSGNGHHAGLTSFTTNPIYRASPTPTASLGLPLVDFSNDAAGMYTGLTLTSYPYTILAVFSGPTTGFHRAVDGSKANVLMGPYSGVIANYASGWVSQISGPTVVVNTLYRAASTQENATSKFYVNGTDYTQNGTFSATFGTVNLGAAGNAAQGLSGYFAELVVYNRVLTGAELTQANTYLGRWFSSGVHPWWASATQQVIGTP
jgi:hypothetical protein